MAIFFSVDIITILRGYKEASKRMTLFYLGLSYFILATVTQRFSCRKKLGTSVSALFLLLYFICETIRLSVTERKL